MPEKDGEGIALLRFKPASGMSEVGEEHFFMLVTYPLPILGSKAVPDMKAFLKKNNLGVAE